ncbi:MAG: response regulator transcription factor [Eubacteriales bacterium]|nr:response regulator transcription factor [Eubacteriales bacterium]
MNNNVLIIEDDKDIREGIRILLEGEGFLVEEAPNGREGLRKLSPKTNLVILDIMMPGISGLKTCEEIRKVSYVPILFLTAKSKESDKLIGFMAGADDYLIKPFSYAELFARVKALLRRHQVYDKETLQNAADGEWIEKHRIRINTSHNMVFLQDDEIQLTEIEYKLLLLMMQYPTKTFSIQNLYESIWEEPFLSSSANTIMVHIRNLRTKIEENPQKPKIIQTVWGKGYRLG